MAVDSDVKPQHKQTRSNEIYVEFIFSKICGNILSII